MSLPFGAFFTGGFGGVTSSSLSTSLIVGIFLSGIVRSRWVVVWAGRGVVVDPGLC